MGLSVLDVCSGAALENLSREPYADLSFPNVRSVRFMFPLLPALERSVDTSFAFPDAEANIEAFLERVKHMVPTIMKVSIALGFHFGDEPQFPVQQLSNLVALFSQHALHIQYQFERQPVAIDQQLTGLCSLVYSSYDATYDGEQIMQLAQRSASTLQVLDITIVTTVDVTSLIQNTDSRYVQYPCLHTLKLCGPQGSGESRPPSFSGAVPFPNLRCLKVEFVFPFGDDTVFRGNAIVLESLILMPSPGTVRILREYEVFTPVSHPRLQHVSMELKADYEPNFSDSDVDYMRFVLSIGPNAPVRTIFDPLSGPGLQSVLPALGEHTCIQVLTMPSVSPRIWEVIAL
ncbi:hypothetical protein FBU31_002493, partial [Coemansia sp. 'formosensis']